MSTKAKKSIETEKNLYEEAVIKRLGELSKREHQDTKILKDTRLRHLKAKIKQANRRLLAISKIEKQIEDSARRKVERLERKPTDVKTKEKSSQKTIAKKKKKEQADGFMSSQNEARKNKLRKENVL